MSRIKLKYVEQFTDRHGKPRFYFRRAGYKRIPLPGLPGSAEFMEAYQAALAGVPRPEIGAGRTIPGTVNAAIVAFYARCNSFRDNKPITQATDRNILEAFRAKHGNKRIAMLEQRHIEHMLAEKAGKPAAQRNLLRVLRVLLLLCHGGHAQGQPGPRHQAKGAGHKRLSQLDRGGAAPIRAASPDWQQGPIGARTAVVYGATPGGRGAQAGSAKHHRITLSSPPCPKAAKFAKPSRLSDRFSPD